MMFKRRPKNPNDMNKDVKKYLKKFEKYLKKNDVDTYRDLINRLGIRK